MRPLCVALALLFVVLAIAYVQSTDYRSRHEQIIGVTHG